MFAEQSTNHTLSVLMTMPGQVTGGFSIVMATGTAVMPRPPKLLLSFCRRAVVLNRVFTGTGFEAVSLGFVPRDGLGSNQALAVCGFGIHGSCHAGGLQVAGSYRYDDC